MSEAGIHLVMPMGGSGSRFTKEGFETPKPMLEIQGMPFFYWSVRSLQKFIPLRSLTFVVLREHVECFGIDAAIHRLFPGSAIRVLGQVLNGAVLTCLEGVKEWEDDAPVIFNDCDHLFRCRALEAFCRRGDFAQPDGALLTFPSHDPKFSFAELDAQGNVTRTVEKQAVSNQAICGAYYFRSRSVFEQAAARYLTRCAYREYFVSGVYNEMAQCGQSIRVFPVDVHVPFGTPEEYREAEQSAAFEELR